MACASTSVSAGCELWAGSAHGNDPDMRLEVQLCERSGHVSGTLQEVGAASGWARYEISGGWDAAREGFADTIAQRIEGLAPGFKSLVLARKAHSPADLERGNANLLGGDLGGGSNAWNRQLLFRPIFPYFRYRMPIERLYLCSSYAHPGAGVHGMCGYNAARIAMRDIE